MATGQYISQGLGSPADIAVFLLVGLTGNAALLPVILTTNVPTGYQNVAYSFQLLAASDGPVTWSVTVGALPTGLTLSAGGLLSGTPTLIESQTFTVTATNAAGDDTQEMTLAIIAAATSRPSYSIAEFQQFRY